MKKLFSRLFRVYAYDIAIRKVTQEESLPTGKNKGEYEFLKADGNYWYADPFCFEKGGETYVFFEIMDNSGRGKIGCATFADGKFSKIQTVLEEPFHLSYPNVFGVNGEVYMIPETNEASQIRMYRAMQFPYVWQLERVLVEHVRVVDTSIYSLNTDVIELYCCDVDNEKRQHWYRVNMCDYSVGDVSLDGRECRRPGGNTLVINGERLRPLQCCDNCYGEKVLFYGMKDDKEQLRNVLTPYDLFGDRTKYERLHTFNRSAHYEVIDLEYLKFYWKRPFIKGWQVLKRGFKR